MAAVDEEHAAAWRPGWRALLALFVGALVLRAPLVAAIDVIQTDSPGYLSVADFFAHPGRYETTPWRITTPLYPAAVFLATAATGLPVLAARLVNVLLGALAVPLLAVLLGRTFGRRAAIFGSLLAGATYALVLDSGTAMTEPLFLVVSLLLTGRCLAAWDRENGPRWSDGLLVGAWLGLAFLTRSTALFQALVILPWLLRIVLRTPARLPVLGLAIVVFVLIGAIPRAVTASRGEPHPSASTAPLLDGTNLAFGNREVKNYRLNEAGTEREFEEIARGTTVLRELTANPALLAKKVLLNLRKTVNETIPGLFRPAVILLLPLAFLGLFFARSRRERRFVILTLLLTAPLVLLLPVLQVRERHFYSVLPLWLGLAGVALTRIPDRFGSPRLRPVCTGLLAAVIALNLGAVGYAFVVNRGAGNVYREAGTWLGSKLPAGRQGIMVRNPEFVSWAGHQRYEVFPAEPLERVLAYARHKGVAYLVLGPAERKLRPRFVRDLEAADGVPEGLREIRGFRGGRDGPLVIYAIE